MNNNILAYIYISKCVDPRRELYFIEFICLFYSYIRVCFQLDVFVREHLWDKV